MSNPFTTDIHYNYTPILSYNCIYNFITSDRSEGKTYGFKWWAINDWINNGNEFGYILRYDTDFTANENFFSKIVENDDFPDWEFKSDSMRAYIRKRVPDIINEDGTKEPGKANKWVCFGYFFALSKQQSYKGNEYPKVTKLCYDEFIKEKGKTSYLPNEVFDMHNLYVTIDRKKWKLKVFFCANRADIVNPFFMYYKITAKDLKNREFIRCGLRDKKKAVIHMYENTASREEISEQGLDDLFDEEYLGYAFGGEFSGDSDTFIREKPKEAVFHYGIVFSGVTFTIWVDGGSGNYFFTRKKAPSTKNIFALTRDDHRPNTYMLERNSQLIKKLKALYSYGYVYFDNIQTRALANEMFSMLGWY